MIVTPPENLESGAAALAARSPLESAYRAEIEREVERFLRESAEYAEESASRAAPIALGVILGLWAATLDRLDSRLPAGSTALAALRSSELPNLAFTAASAQVAATVGLGLSVAEIRARISTALGLARAPFEGLGGAFGRLLLDATGDSTRSWEGESETMARTAATADIGAATIEQLRAQGYTHKRWMTRYDSRVRDAHVLADRDTILLDESFIVGGTALRYPADPMSTDLSQVINCRCVLVGVRYGRHKLDHPEGATPWDNPRP